ncbi:MAG TPA: hypothetical protein VII65_08495 [Acidimicrobiales bacterium]
MPRKTVLAFVDEDDHAWILGLRVVSHVSTDYLISLTAWPN